MHSLKQFHFMRVKDTDLHSQRALAKHVEKDHVLRKSCSALALTFGIELSSIMFKSVRARM